MSDVILEEPRKRRKESESARIDGKYYAWTRLIFDMAGK
jgi:hypothetical protein